MLSQYRDVTAIYPDKNINGYLIGWFLFDVLVLCNCIIAVTYDEHKAMLYYTTQ